MAAAGGNTISEYKRLMADGDYAEIQTVIAAALGLGRKATDADLAPTWQTAAETYVYAYVGDFAFLGSLKDSLYRFGSLTPRQAAAAINCMVKDREWIGYFGTRGAARVTVQLAPQPTALPSGRGVYEAAGRDLDAEVLLRNRANIHGERYVPVAWVEQAPTATAEPVADSTSTFTPLPVSAAEAPADDVDDLSRFAGHESTGTASVGAPVVADGTYTVVVSATGEYNTIRLRKAGDWAKGLPEWAQVAAYLSGSDNESDYKQFAFVIGREVRIWKQFHGDSSLAAALRYLVSDAEVAKDAGMMYALESGNCYRCGRKLTVPASIHRGLGPICADKE